MYGKKYYNIQVYKKVLCELTHTGKGFNPPNMYGSHKHTSYLHIQNNPICGEKGYPLHREGRKEEKMSLSIDEVNKLESQNDMMAKQYNSLVKQYNKLFEYCRKLENEQKSSNIR